MSNKEVKASELEVGNVIIAKQSKNEYTIEKISVGVGGSKTTPYLILRDSKGDKQEHDTSFDSYSATYTVKEKANE